MLEKNKLNQDVILYKQDEYILKDRNLLCKTDSSSFTMGIILNGNSSFESLENNYKINVKAGNTIIDIANKDTTLGTTLKDTHKQFIGINIPKYFLEQNLPNNKIKDDFLDFLENGKGRKNISNKKTNPITQALALELFNNPYTNNLEKLYTESKVLELIYTEVSSLFQQNEIRLDNNVKFSNQDKEAIYHAREILISNLSNPPTMKELARIVAINDLKLKVGFHKFFNETPYSISVECRLQEAKKLLGDGELHIKEIAQLVGYKYASNFTQAFLNRFGVRPKDLLKSRKYYH